MDKLSVRFVTVTQTIPPAKVAGRSRWAIAPVLPSRNSIKDELRPDSAIWKVRSRSPREAVSRPVATPRFNSPTRNPVQTRTTSNDTTRTLPRACVGLGLRWRVRISFVS